MPDFALGARCSALGARKLLTKPRGAVARITRRLHDDVSAAFTLCSSYSSQQLLYNVCSMLGTCSLSELIKLAAFRLRSPAASHAVRRSSDTEADTDTRTALQCGCTGDGDRRPLSISRSLTPIAVSSGRARERLTSCLFVSYCPVASPADHRRVTPDL